MRYKQIAVGLISIGLAIMLFSGYTNNQKTSNKTNMEKAY